LICDNPATLGAVYAGSRDPDVCREGRFANGHPLATKPQATRASPVRPRAHRTQDERNRDRLRRTPPQASMS